MDIFNLYNNIDAQKIKEFVDNRQEENLFLDFKTVNSSNLSNHDDKRNFARALSGFANSDGGLIVWGVEAKKNNQNIDCACGIREIEPLPLFVSKLNEYTGQFVTPIVDGVNHKKIVTSGDKGFAITLVPASDAGPHMAEAGEDRYYKRSGDSFYRMEHFDIEDMFGRRKKPKLSLYTDIIQTGTTSSSRGKSYSLSVIVGIQNLGRGTAKYPYLALTINSPYKVDDSGLSNGRSGLPCLPRSPISPQVRFGGDANTVIHPNSIHEITKISFNIDEGATNIGDLIIEWEITAEDMRAVKQTTVITKDEMIARIRP